MKYEESNLSKALPTVFMHNQYKVCDMKTFVSVPMICCSLVFDLADKRFRCFLSCVDFESDYEQRAIRTIENGSELPHRLAVTIFRDYFMKEELMKLLDKDFKIILGLLKLMDEK
jgi:hypothetical protein